MDSAIKFSHLLPVLFDSDFAKSPIGRVLSSVGTVISVGLNVTPAVLFYEIIKGKRVISEVPEMMFITGISCCILNLGYSILLDDFMMKLSNAICTALQLIYIAFFLFYYTNKNCVKIALFIFIWYNLAFELFYIVAVLFKEYLNVETAKNIVGWVTVVFSAANAWAPGQKIFTVMKTGNFKLIAIWTTCAQFLCSFFWCVYNFLIPGALQGALSNLLGSLLTGFQIVIYFINYCRYNGVPPESKEEEGESKEEKKFIENSDEV